MHAVVHVGSYTMEYVGLKDLSVLIQIYIFKHVMQK